MKTLTKTRKSLTAEQRADMKNAKLEAARAEYEAGKAVRKAKVRNLIVETASRLEQVKGNKFLEDTTRWQYYREAGRFNISHNEARNMFREGPGPEPVATKPVVESPVEELTTEEPANV
jgi:hypothetical protein